MRVGDPVRSPLYRTTSSSALCKRYRPSQVGVAKSGIGARSAALDNVSCGHVCRLRLHLFHGHHHTDCSTADITSDCYASS